MRIGDSARVVLTIRLKGSSAPVVIEATMSELRSVYERAESLLGRRPAGGIIRLTSKSGEMFIVDAAEVAAVEFRRAVASGSGDA